mgnify:CR=1 FL=1
MKTNITFQSHGLTIAGVLYLPDDFMAANAPVSSAAIQQAASKNRPPAAMPKSFLRRALLP